MSDITKEVSRKLNDVNVGELSPGTTPRRYEPDCGIRKHNERIHKESAFADKYKNLPFKFSKPKKAKRSVTKVCGNCGAYVSVHKDTIGVICSKCHKYANVEEVSFG